MECKSYKRLVLAGTFIVGYFLLCGLMLIFGKDVTEMVKPLPGMMGMVIGMVVVQYGNEKKNSGQAGTPASAEKPLAE